MRIKCLSIRMILYLLVGSRSRATLPVELNNITSWAKRNNLRLNATKSLEMLVKNRRCTDPPPLLKDVVRVDSMHILGVTLGQDLRVTAHVHKIIEACSSSLHALRILRSHGLTTNALHVVAEATTLAKLLYAVPVWWGLATATDRRALDRLHARTQRLGYLPFDNPTIEERVTSAEKRLFRSILSNEFHVLRRLLHP